MKKTAQHRGFTLIEMMVAVVITMSLVTVGVVAFTNFAATQRMSKAKSEVMSSLRLAKNYAVTNQYPTGWNQGTMGTLDYVEVRMTTAGVMTVYGGNNRLGVGTTYFQKRLIVDPAVTVSAVNSGTLLFSAYEGKLLFLSCPTCPTPIGINETRAVIINSAEGGGQIKDVILSPSGAIEEGEISYNGLPTATPFPSNTPIPTIACSTCSVYSTELMACQAVCGRPCDATCVASVRLCNSRTCYRALEVAGDCSSCGLVDNANTACQEACGVPAGYGCTALIQLCGGTTCYQAECGSPAI